MMCLWIAERLFARDKRRGPFGACGSAPRNALGGDILGGALRSAG